MDICIYKNLRVSEYIRLSKKKTQKIHRKMMWCEINGKTALMTLLDTEYLSTDKKRCFEEPGRKPSTPEIAQFIEYHKKTITRYLVEKSFCEEITDPLERNLCEKFDVFNYNEPKDFDFFTPTKKRISVKLELSNMLRPYEKETYIFDNYDEKFFPPRPKGELTYQQMFEYWSKLFEEKGINYPPSHFDNPGFMFEITSINKQQP